MRLPCAVVWTVLASLAAVPAGAQDAASPTPSTPVEEAAPAPATEGSQVDPFAAPAQDPGELPLFEPVAKPDPEAVLRALTLLEDRGRDRPFFGLPEKEIWRAAGPIRVALYSDQRAELTPVLKSAALSFARAGALPIELSTARPLAAVAGAEAVRWATGANLEILVGPRPVMAQFSSAIPVNRWMQERFEEGAWNFTFAFPREESLIGRVMIAGDQPPEALESSIMLALVWALGGVSLGDQLQGLVETRGPLPTLTPLGREVFALMYHPKLEAGLPIPEALREARRLVEP